MVRNGVERMTEKRYSHDGVVIKDHLKKDLIYIEGRDDLLELAEYVDRLQEENEQLKQTIQDMRIRFKRKYDHEFDDIVDELD